MIGGVYPISMLGGKMQRFCMLYSDSQASSFRVLVVSENSIVGIRYVK